MTGGISQFTKEIPYNNVKFLTNTAQKLAVLSTTAFMLIKNIHKINITINYDETCQ